MIKNMLSWFRFDKKRRDEIIGAYILPLAIPLGIILIGIVVFVAGRYKKAEEFFKYILKKWEKRKGSC